MSSVQKNEVYIAVIDDSDFSRKSIIQILEKEGFNIVGEAASAEAALHISRTTSANLYIIDIVMPEISGIELAKHISDQARNRNINIIMISSLKMEHIIVESISNGAIDFLQKPFSKEDLVRSVSKISSQMEHYKGI